MGICCGLRLLLFGSSSFTSIHISNTDFYQKPFPLPMIEIVLHKSFYWYSPPASKHKGSSPLLCHVILIYGFSVASFNTSPAVPITTIHYGEERIGFLQPGSWFSIKMPSYQYRKSHCGDKTVVRSSYLHNGISYTGKMASLYWFRPQFLVSDRGWQQQRHINLHNLPLFGDAGEWYINRSVVWRKRAYGIPLSCWQVREIWWCFSV